jgi:O-antigen/teichoic acid export membrane protein
MFNTTIANEEQQIKNSFVYIVSIVIVSLVPVVALPIFTRMLSKEDFGVLALAQIYAVFMSGIANIGLTNVYNRNFFQYQDQKSASGLLYSTIIFVVNNFFILAFVTYIFREPLSKIIIGSTQHGNLLFWAFCSSGIISLKSYYLSYFKNSENAKSFAIYSINESILTFALCLFFVVYRGTGVIGLIWGQLVANIIIFSVLTAKSISLLPVSFSKSILKDSLRIGYPLTPKVFFSVISNQFDKYMIGQLASAGGVGIYSIAQKVSYLIFKFMTAFHNVYQPQVFKRMFDQGKKGGESVGRYLTPFLYLSVATALLIVIFAEEAIWILAPKSYHAAIDIVIILSMFYGLLFFGKQPQLLFAKKTHIIPILTFISIALNVILNIFFILRWGAIGAAWATFLAGLISGSISFAVSQYHYEIKWQYKKIFIIYLIFFCSAISTLLLRHFALAYEFRLIVKFVFMVAYIYVGVTLKLITIDNYRVIRNIISVKRDGVSKHIEGCDSEELKI